MIPSVGQQRLIKAYNLISLVPAKYVSLKTVGLRAGNNNPARFNYALKITSYAEARIHQCYGGPAGWLCFHPDMTKEGLTHNAWGDPVYQNQAYERGLAAFFELKDTIEAFQLFSSVENEMSRGGTKIAYPENVNDRDRWLIRVKHHLISNGVDDLDSRLIATRADFAVKATLIPITSNKPQQIGTPELSPLSDDWKAYKHWGHEYGY